MARACKMRASRDVLMKWMVIDRVIILIDWKSSCVVCCF